MQKSTTANLAARSGCLASLLGPIIALIFYPRLNWLFATPILFFAALYLASRFDRGPSPSDVAKQAEKILRGADEGWEIDDYEHMHPREPRLNELWRETLKICDLPESWVHLNEHGKSELRRIISEMRSLNDSSISTNK